MASIFSTSKSRNRSLSSSMHSLVSQTEENGASIAPTKPLSKMAKFVGVASNAIHHFKSPSTPDVAATARKRTGRARRRSNVDSEVLSDIDTVATTSSFSHQTEERAQVLIHELEEVLRSAKGELGLKSEAQATLTASFGEEHRISPLAVSQVEHHDSRMKNLEEGWDRTLTSIRYVEDADVLQNAQARLRDLEDPFKASQTDVSTKSEPLSVVAHTAEGLQSQDEILKTELRDALAASKKIEAERDEALNRVRNAQTAQANAEARVHELGDVLKSTQAELNPKSRKLATVTGDYEKLDRVLSQIYALSIKNDKLSLVLLIVFAPMGVYSRIPEIVFELAKHGKQIVDLLGVFVVLGCILYFTRRPLQEEQGYYYGIYPF
ncbi:hypothetical protein BDN70DRAFT_117159 [Pholiota conissans]|uniref:Uncharacterized protein n=1 Tax=Pholiota conissans TaxID=109636 RepID=A0A9P5YX03_9AGAR|nr:hypothetical protein BDN70DRAFT_117159 [Pholiota conissans]